MIIKHLLGCNSISFRYSKLFWCNPNETIILLLCYSYSLEGVDNEMHLMPTGGSCHVNHPLDTVVGGTAFVALTRQIFAYRIWIIDSISMEFSTSFNS